MGNTTEQMIETNLITANAIAKRINRSRICVVEQIEKLGIIPAITLPGGIKYYSPSVAPSIADAMRAPNSDDQSL